MRPLIGITGHRHSFPLQSTGPALLGVALSDDYAHGVAAAGGLPVVIPFLEGEAETDALADRLDGLLLAGGEDVDPALYGEPPHIGLGSVIPERDMLEARLFRRVMAQGKPILGICRGIQMINALLGGTLYQDLPREWRGGIQHSQRARRNHETHAIRVAPDSRLYDLLGRPQTLRSNSFHHQAVKQLGQGLRAVAWDEEGLVEAVEHETYPFLVAVQWHPENLWRDDPVHLGVFRGLVEAAAERA
ncbi:MAG: gamma-glutamyl-gamma-aminobutyrate hydrolase family protein [Thermoflavifilum sp.]|nr:gamma-glutamyl-gamma-aminobutyrate hydrolase family protein [Thermoflavifilum sp.]MCL6513684.1 gamma-glutamyl-gamma-aminobutyrate hydrolase family protein [Alicyclobacillus sp.]